MKGMLLFLITLTMMLVMQTSLEGPGDFRGRADGSVETKKAGESKDSFKPLSEVQFQVTETSLGRARLIPVKVKEEIAPEPGYCGAQSGSKTIEGTFRLEFDIDGKQAASYVFENLMFVKDSPKDAYLHKSDLPLAGQGKEQVLIFQYETCSSQAAMIFGYDLREKKIVQYFVGDYGSEAFIPIGSTRQFLDKGKPEGILQNWAYTQVWGTLLI